MTINIAIAVSEGLVMAADSLSQMCESGGTIRSIHQSVEKITEIRGRAIAVMVNGLGEIKNRTIISLIREFEFWAYKEDGMAFRSKPLSGVASDLAVFIGRKYTEEYPPEKITAESALGIIIGGYTPGEFFPELIEINFPGQTWNRILPASEGRPEGQEYFDFWGQKVSLNKIMHGYDADSVFQGQRALKVFEYIDKKEPGANFSRWRELMHDTITIPNPPNDLLSTLKDLSPFLGMSHRLRGMPLQEAVEFAEYLGNVAIGYDRFCAGQSRVGGDLDVVAIQPDGLHWYKRKAFVKEMSLARERAIEESDREKMRSTSDTMGRLLALIETAGMAPSATKEAPVPLLEPGGEA